MLSVIIHGTSKNMTLKDWEDIRIMDINGDNTIDLYNIKGKKHIAYLYGDFDKPPLQQLLNEKINEHYTDICVDYNIEKDCDFEKLDQEEKQIIINECKKLLKKDIDKL